VSAVENVCIIGNCYLEEFSETIKLSEKTSTLTQYSLSSDQGLDQESVLNPHRSVHSIKNY
jgi:hypothetical protein